MDEDKYCPQCGPDRQFDPYEPFCPDHYGDLVSLSVLQEGAVVPNTAVLPTSSPMNVTSSGSDGEPMIPNGQRTRMDSEGQVSLARIILVVDGKLIPINDGQTVHLGRAPEFEHAALFTNRDNVSRIHCTIRLSAGQLIVTDLDSANGTFVDDQRIDATIPVAVPFSSRLRLAADVPIEIIT